MEYVQRCFYAKNGRGWNSDQTICRGLGRRGIVVAVTGITVVCGLLHFQVFCTYRQSGTVYS